MSETARGMKLHLEDGSCKLDGGVQPPYKMHEPTAEWRMIVFSYVQLLVMDQKSTNKSPILFDSSLVFQ